MEKRKSMIVRTKKRMVSPILFKNIKRLLSSVCLLFVILSIISYNVHDTSWAFVSCQQSPITNWCGWIGAHISAFLFYCFGYAAYLLIPLYLFCIYSILCITTIMQMVPRLFLALWVIVLSSFLIQLHYTVICSDLSYIFPGGFVGFYLESSLLCVCNRIGSFLIAYTLLALGIMILIPIPWNTVWNTLTVILKIAAFWNKSDAHTALKKNREHRASPHHMQPNKQPETTSKQSVTEHTYTIPTDRLFMHAAEEEKQVTIPKEVHDQVSILEEKLAHFGVQGHVVSIKQGPVVTLFEYQPTINSKISKILALEDDLALALKAVSIRIIAPIPGRSVIGLEISNKNMKTVLFSTIIKTNIVQESTAPLPLILGKDTVGNVIMIDLSKMPHLLVAGSTGSGKSIALNTMLMSLLCKHAPDQLRLLLIDPKRLEFSVYDGIPHLLFPIITHPKQSMPALRWIVQEMEHRYENMALAGVRNIQDYNDYLIKNQRAIVPYIVVMIDELADLMMMVAREVEDLIARITQMARAAGIHMIVATQRPSVDIITGTIKVNFPARISFRVTSKIDSRTILDITGAERLLGKGDMLFLDPQSSAVMRVHGAYVSDHEIRTLVEHIKSQQQVSYVTLDETYEQASSLVPEEDAELLAHVVAYIKTVDEISISLLQRKFRIGYNRSARIIEMLERQGLILPVQGGKSRKVIH